MKKNILIAITALLLASCGSLAPMSDPIVKMEEQGDLAAAASIDLMNGINFAAAGAVTDHIGVQLSGHSRFKGETRLGFPILGTEYGAIKGSAGYFWSFPQSHTMLGLYGGVELGRDLERHYLANYADDEYYTPLGSGWDVHRMGMQRYFAQADFAWSPRPWVQLSARLALGLSHDSRHLVESHWTEYQPEPGMEGAKFEVDEYPYPCPKKDFSGSYFFSAFTFQVALGGPHVKQYFTATISPEQRLYGNYYRELNNIGMGLMINLNVKRH